MTSGRVGEVKARTAWCSAGLDPTKIAQTPIEAVLLGHRCLQFVGFAVEISPALIDDLATASLASRKGPSGFSLALIMTAPGGALVTFENCAIADSS